jgi:hypothetical protein
VRQLNFATEMIQEIQQDKEVKGGKECREISGGI